MKKNFTAKNHNFKARRSENRVGRKPDNTAAGSEFRENDFYLKELEAELFRTDNALEKIYVAKRSTARPLSSKSLPKTANYTAADVKTEFLESNSKGQNRSESANLGTNLTSPSAVTNTPYSEQDPEQNLEQGKNLKEHNKTRVNRRSKFLQVQEDRLKQQYDLKSSPLLKDRNVDKSLSALEYKQFDLSVIKAKIRQERLALRAAKSIKEAEVSYTNLLVIWNNFQDNYQLALIRKFELETEHKLHPESGKLTEKQDWQFYTAELKSRELAYPEIKKSIYRAFMQVAEQEWFPELSKYFGKFLLYRINAFYTLSSLGIDFDFATENSLKDNIVESTKLYLADFSESSSDNENISSSDTQLGSTNMESGTDSGRDSALDTIIEKYIALVNWRKAEAEKFAFPNFSAYALYRQSYYNYSEEKLSQFAADIKHYILPIQVYTSRQWRHCFKNEQAEISADEKDRRGPEEFTKYYQETFKDYDWELRDLNEMMASINENKFQQKFYPQCELVNINLSYKDYWEKLTNVVESAIDRKNRGIYKDMLKLSSLILLPAQPGEKYELHMAWLRSSEIPVIYGNISKSQNYISDFCYAFASVYTELIRNTIVSSKHILLEPSSESQKFGQYSLEMMVLARIEPLLKEDSLTFLKNNFYRKLITILSNTMLYEFENKIYNLPSQDLTRVNVKNIFVALVKEYALDEYFSDLKNNPDILCFLQTNLLNNPCASLINNLAIIGSISMFREFNEDKRKARLDYEKFCYLTGQNVFLEELKASNIADPMSTDTVKITAFTIASQLEAVGQPEDSAKAKNKI